MKWYEVDNTASIDTPALLIYKDRLRQNIEKAISIVGDTSRLRPHIKTNKSAEVCRMLMEAGVEKFKCATIAEAELLGDIKAKDVLLAYQPVGPKVKRLLDIIQHFPDTRYSCLVDNIDAAKQLARASEEQHITATVLIDINTGMNRTGVKPERAGFLLDELLAIAALEVKGFHIYDGHIIDSSFDRRRERSDAGYAATEKVQGQFKQKTKKEPQIVVGGSPTFRTHVNRNAECSPGTFVFWDMGYAHLFPDEPFIIAALVLTRIVSIVDDHTITTDLGYKAVASENPLPRVYFFNAPGAHVEFQNEEHLVVKVADSKLYKPGDILYGVPEHICPTVALYDEAFVIENHRFVERWDVAGRRRGINTNVHHDVLK